jgi:three-Cys-motif partner protein
MQEEFFDEQMPGSKIKSKIVSTYFVMWARIMIQQVKHRGRKIGYLDFFCGPGKYQDGCDSTPLIILKEALGNTDLSEMLVTVFNDANPSNVEKLEQEISELQSISSLRYKPTFMKTVVGQDIVDQMKKIELIPSLIFIDPFGYKGLTLNLIASVIKDWGCHCIFFFNYNRINAALNNPFMKGHVDALFGSDTAEALKNEVKGLSPLKRQQLLLKYFQQELKKIKGAYSISYKFYKHNSNKTSHFIFFVSKHPLAYKLMKQTMAENSDKRGGVPTYEYNPSKKPISTQVDLFGLADDYGIHDLAFNLLKIYKGKTTNRKNIYDEHNYGNPYIEANYKDALLLLEKKGEIVCDPPIEKRRKYQGQPTLGETVSVTFKL